MSPVILRPEGSRTTLLTAALLALVGHGYASNASAAAPGVRTVDLVYAVEVTGAPVGAGPVTLWLPVPGDDEDQTTLDTRIVSPYPVTLTKETEYGNRMLVLTTDRLDKDSFAIEVTYRIRRTEHRTDFAATDVRESVNPRFRAPSAHAVMNDAVRGMAKEAVGDRTDPLDKARAIYDYVLAHMRYDKSVPGWGKGDVNRICLAIGKGESGAGNCTDFHSLFASMMQAEGIPVKFEMGYPLKPGEEMTTPNRGGYHCWARFWIEGKGWIPVDISEAAKDPSKRDYYFGALCENRVRFSVGRDIELIPPQIGERLNFFGPDPYIEIGGKPFDGFSRTVAYRDVE
ncbi:MAG: transglutaminase domain-containing protein [Nitrospinae bacterium]|nr:transglutaminase domain-containing protein [Nitrospinota bacterium]